MELFLGKNNSQKHKKNSSDESLLCLAKSRKRRGEIALLGKFYSVAQCEMLKKGEKPSQTVRL